MNKAAAGQPKGKDASDIGFYNLPEELSCLASEEIVRFIEAHNLHHVKILEVLEAKECSSNFMRFFAIMSLGCVAALSPCTCSRGDKDEEEFFDIRVKHGFDAVRAWRVGNPFVAVCKDEE
jgi:hypothetical protein